MTATVIQLARSYRRHPCCFGFVALSRLQQQQQYCATEEQKFQFIRSIMMLVDRLIAGITDTRRSRTAVTVISRTTFLFSYAILHLVLLIPHSVFCLLPLHPPYHRIEGTLCATCSRIAPCYKFGAFSHGSELCASSSSSAGHRRLDKHLA